MNTCPSCGAAVDTRDAHCRYCGAELYSETVPQQTAHRDERHAAGQSTQGPPTAASQQPPPRQQRTRPHETGTDRRTLLAGGGAVVALGVGAFLVLGDNTEDDTATQPDTEQVRDVPAAAFGFDFDAASQGGQLTITCQSTADEIWATNLYVRGTDLARTGQWNGSTNDDGTITAGDSWRIPVDSSAYEVRVVWEPADGGQPSVLDSSAGPDA